MHRFFKDERGFTFIELIIVIVLLSLIAVSFIGALVAGSRTIILADERATAESLARSQMESIKHDTYVITNPNELALYSRIEADLIPEGYLILSRVDGDVEDAIYGVPWNNNSNTISSIETGLQKFDIVIEHEGNEVWSLVGYKTYRAPLA